MCQQMIMQAKPDDMHPKLKPDTLFWDPYQRYRWDQLIKAWM